MYAPQTGHCVVGPCQGKRLSAIPVTEEAGVIKVHVDQF
jgi:nitrite reductase/ring-hydroxylating ferredoxin subunit